MKRILIASLLLSSCALFAQKKVYTLNLDVPEKEIKTGHLKLGGTSPDGGSIAVNSFYMTVNGQPAIPVMGEFHYSRYPAEQWEEQILKMKAGGVNVIPTYVFWSISVRIWTSTT